MVFHGRAPDGERDDAYAEWRDECDAARDRDRHRESADPEHLPLTDAPTAAGLKDGETYRIVESHNAGTAWVQAVGADSYQEVER